MSELRAILRSFDVEANMPVTTLKSIKCAERRGHPKEWTLDGLTLGQINLIVGMNATGKSRTINAINNLARILFPEAKARAMFGEYDVLFDSGGQHLRYIVAVEQGKVIKEEFYRDGDPLLQRGPSGEGEIFAELENKNIRFKPPESDLAAVFRRDSLQHPFLEPLHDWASSVRHYAFGSSLGKEEFVAFLKDGPEPDERDANQIVGVFAKARKRFEQAFLDTLKQDMTRMGYDVDDIELCVPELLTVLPPGLPATVQGIGVRERGIGGIVDQLEMSQGMFRALSILIQVNYAVMAHRSYCILIDDIGEGLDFDRSTRLIELLREKALESSFQLIMATNDRFVMDHVPLEEWSVLQRHGGHVRVLNNGNSRELFEDFKFTGLSNFSFLETDFAKGPIEEATAHE
jgi:AAA domain, putative AbiEii toxin, Type IV TA system